MHAYVYICLWICVYLEIPLYNIRQFLWIYGRNYGMAGTLDCGEWWWACVVLWPPEAPAEQLLLSRAGEVERSEIGVLRTSSAAGKMQASPQSRTDVLSPLLLLSKSFASSSWWQRLRGSQLARSLNRNCRTIRQSAEGLCEGVEKWLAQRLHLYKRRHVHGYLSCHCFLLLNIGSNFIKFISKIMEKYRKKWVD